MTDQSWDTIDRYMILSSDAHAGAETHQYRDYLEKRWQEDFDAWVVTLAHPFIDLRDPEAAAVNWEPDRRLAAMDLEGDTGQVLFPNTVPPFFDILVHLTGVPRTASEFEHKWAGLQAHNRWLVEFCQADPKRLKGLIQLMPNDVDTAIAEARWAKESGVIAGVMLPGIPPNHPVPPYFHESYDRLWAACVELELPVHQHQGTGSPDAGQDSPAATAIWFTELDRWTQRTLLHLIFGGVFERHPELKFVWTEMWGMRWVLEELHRMERRLPELRTQGAYGEGVGRADDPRRLNFSIFGSPVLDGLSLSPTEYWQRNCYLGASLLPRHEVRYRHAVGVDRIMWGMDFPHPEGATHHGLEALRATFYDVPEAECRGMFAGVAAEVYGFDLEALTPIAERIGPRVADVHAQLPEAEFPMAPSAAFDTSVPLEELIVR
jgi:predicted TIM-barrel fold metal-dependent hydrolase